MFSSPTTYQPSGAAAAAANAWPKPWGSAVKAPWKAMRWGCAFSFGLACAVTLPQPATSTGGRSTRLSEDGWCTGTGKQASLLGEWLVWSLAGSQLLESIACWWWVSTFLISLLLLNTSLNAIWLAVCKGCLSLTRSVSVLCSLVRYRAVLWGLEKHNSVTLLILKHERGRRGDSLSVVQVTAHSLKPALGCCREEPQVLSVLLTKGSSKHCSGSGRIHCCSLQCATS